MMIQTFSTFCRLQEANTSRAIEFERYIANTLTAMNEDARNPDAWARNKHTRMKGRSVPPKERTAVTRIAQTVLETLTSRRIHAATFERSGGTGGALSEFYQAQGVTDTTSKCDIRSTDNRFRFSVKNAGGAALASGSEADQRAAFYWVLNAHPNPTTNYHTIGEQILKAVDTYMATIPPPAGIEKVIDVRHMTTVGAKPGVLDAARTPRADWSAEIKDWLKLIAQRDRDMKETIGKQLQTALASDADFRRFYTFECATGQGKFGDIGLSGPATANYMLTFDYDGRARVDAIDGPNAPIIQTYARNMTFRFRWKHGPKTRVSLDLSKAFLQGELDESYVRVEQSTPRTISDFWLIESRDLARRLLTEGLGDTVRTRWAQFTNWLTTAIQKLKATVTRALAVGLGAVLEFFELTPDGISASWPTARV